MIFGSYQSLRAPGVVHRRRPEARWPRLGLREVRRHWAPVRRYAHTSSNPIATKISRINGRHHLRGQAATSEPGDVAASRRATPLSAAAVTRPASAAVSRWSAAPDASAETAGAVGPIAETAQRRELPVRPLLGWDSHGRVALLLGRSLPGTLSDAIAKATRDEAAIDAAAQQHLSLTETQRMEVV